MVLYTVMPGRYFHPGQIVGFFLFFVVIRIRRKALAKAAKLVKADHESYDVFWKMLKKEDAESVLVNHGSEKESHLEAKVEIWRNKIEKIAGVHDWKKKKRDMGWQCAYLDEGGKSLKSALFGIKNDFKWLANACQSEPVKALKYEQEEKLDLNDLINRLKKCKTLERYIDQHGVVDAARDSEKISPKVNVKITSNEGEQEEHLEDLIETEEMSRQKKEKLHKDLIETVVKRVHGASRAAGMSFSKPRQVIDDMAVLYAQAMELNEVCASKREVAVVIRDAL